MQLVVVLIRLELRDLLLPVRVQNVAIGPIETLIDLLRIQSLYFELCGRWTRTFCHAPVNSCGSGACPCAAIYDC